MKKVFFSYSHADEVIRDKLDQHLSLLKRQGYIETWYDRNIDAGSNINETIKLELSKSDIILLLISSAFINSDYCYDIEMKMAMAQLKAGTSKVIPIIARPCDWHDAPFGALNACPNDGLAISTWENEDVAMLEVVKSLNKVIKN